MDIFFYILLLLIGGCFAGFMAGLLGIGGGIVITPIQYYLLTSIGCDAKTALTVTFATGLAVIGTTMTNSSRKHIQNHLVVEQHLKSMMILGFTGAVIGAIIAQYIDVSILKITFGLICIISTVALVLVKSPDSLDNIKTEGYLFNFFAFIAALFNGLVGPAGAAFLIPIFVAYLKYPNKNTIGTTSLLSVTTALGGVVCYIILGLNVQGLPDFSLGYVNLLQFVFLTVTSIIVAGYAANLAQKISVNKLKVMQVIVISYIGLQMMGVFDMFL
ncbi:MAG: sulfite exporter TauE/SafE family protein [Methanobrevibacter sp.]|nr:sulfite exporter TauE/SafE family protein [Methanobrevibacter sp.]